MNQREEIEAFILQHGSITRAQAASHLHIYELANRISEIETKRGLMYERTPIKGKTSAGRKWRCIRYSL